MPRNRRLAEVFQKVVQGVERSGKELIKFSDIPLKKEKENLNTVLVTNIIITARPSLLEKIREGNMDSITLKTVGHLIDKGFIELYAKTRGAKYILARRYYKETSKLGERTKRIGLSRDRCKELSWSKSEKTKREPWQSFCKFPLN